MKTNSLHRFVKRLLAALLAAAVLVPVSTASAWWGPAAGWDPQEAYMHEYGLLDPYGPTPGDFRRMQRDNWRAFMGYPVYIDNVGPRGPSRGDVIRQHRRMYRPGGYWY